MTEPLQQGLADALAALRAGRDKDARQRLDRLRERWPADADVLQLSGMLLRKQGDQRGAAELFRQSLAARPAQPHVQHGLGNALLALGEREAARKAYEAALALAPDFLDARIALGECELADGAADAAVATLRSAVTAAPGNGRAWSSLGRALRTQGEHDEAIEALTRAAQLRPGHVGTLYNLAVALRLGGRPQDAALLLEECLRLRPGMYEASFVLGHCRQELGEIEAAIAAYRQAIAARPGSREAHDSLSRLLWQHGDSERYLESYGQALVRNPDDTPLLADLAAKLSQVGQVEQAVGILRDAIARGLETPEICYRLGQALATHKGPAREEAIAPLRKAALASPPDHGARYEWVRLLLEMGRLEEARDALQPLRDALPFDQQGIALDQLHRRLTGEEREPAAIHAERTVWSGVLAPPPGYADITQFNRDLAALLGQLHHHRQHPLDQTLRNGTQTVGELLDRREPLLRSLRAMLENAITDYIARMPDDESHPLFARKSAQFRFSGSWSVRLASEGHHLSHIHPAGWISSCYYVSVPDTIAQGEDDAGCLVLGRSNLDCGPADQVAQIVRPRPGLLALFPSYLYHGTVPFRSDQPRLTVAFDVVPA
ncbi:tetratricopeptide repeat protein [Novosphingobium aquimarinum]|uniref:tetratricopeptide repeat protein n=1 Tax=Novosphingobium aquimarinum TaxID=2682494 RepID=UPI0012EC16B4|nr:tetratricopeptide repeat protein [Novosphingobium aquimarinum]